MIPTSTHRDVFAAHDAACTPCRELFVFARERGDVGALAAWRDQLAAHLAADRERREYDRRVRQLLVGGSWTPERVAAFRAQRRADEAV